MFSQAFEAIVNPRIVMTSDILHILAKRDDAMPLHSIKLTQHAKLREFIHDPSNHASEIQASYRTTFSEILLLRERHRSLDPAFPPKDKAIFFMAYSIALSYGIVLNTILLRRVVGMVEPWMQESEVLMDEIFALLEAAIVFAPLGSSAMSSLLFAAWPNNPTRRPAIEAWLKLYQGGFPITRWLETAMWLDEMLMPRVGFGEEPGYRRIPSRPAGACNVM